MRKTVIYFFLTVALGVLMILLIYSNQSPFREIGWAIAGICLAYAFFLQQYKGLLIPITRSRKRAKQLILLQILVLAFVIISLLSGSILLFILSAIILAVLIGFILQYALNPLFWLRSGRKIFDNTISKKRVYSALMMSFGRNLADFKFNCDLGGTTASAVAELENNPAYNEIYIYWDRQAMETECDTQLKKPTGLYLEMSRKREEGHKPNLKGQYVETQDERFDGLYTTITSKPLILDLLENEFLKTVIRSDLSTLQIEGDKINIKVDGIEEELKDIFGILILIQKLADKIL